MISGGQHLTWTRWQQRCPGGISGWVTRRVVEYKWKVLPQLGETPVNARVSYFIGGLLVASISFTYLPALSLRSQGGRCGRNTVANTSTSSCFGFHGNHSHCFEEEYRALGTDRELHSDADSFFIFFPCTHDRFQWISRFMHLL